MSEITKPIALDESLHTTEQTPRNLADVLSDELQNLATAISGGSDKVPKTDIATVEPTNTASRAYSVGELVYVNGNLYKVITAIASGATFTVGTNIQSTNVSGTVKDALDVIGDTSVYSFFNDTVKVTRTGSIVIAQFTGAQASNFISGGRFVGTVFLNNYPNLKPSLAVLGVGLLYRNDNENYTATIEIGTDGNVIMTYKTAVNTRTVNIADSNYRIYGCMTWLKE